MKVAVFSTKSYDRSGLEAANKDAHALAFFRAQLAPETAPLAEGAGAVCLFVNDVCDAAVLQRLAKTGVKLVVLRAAGFNNVDLAAARELGLTVARVPAYSPHAVAEHAVALMLTLDRKIHRAYNRVRKGNFELEGLVGFDLCGKTVGIVGTGAIGAVAARIMNGFGCHLLGHDPRENPDCVALGLRYVPIEDLFARSDIVTLHCPLTPTTRHLVNEELLAKAKRGLMLINTSRGAVVDTLAVIAGLKNGTVGSLGLDVYEEEAHLFFEDLSNRVIRDDIFARLLTFPNVVITGHQGFFTHEALAQIAETTIENITAFETTGKAVHEVSVERLAPRG